MPHLLCFGSCPLASRQVCNRGSNVAQLSSGPCGADPGRLVATTSHSKDLHNRLLAEAQSQYRPPSEHALPHGTRTSMKSCELYLPLGTCPQLLSTWLSGVWGHQGVPLLFKKD